LYIGVKVVQNIKITSESLKIDIRLKRDAAVLMLLSNAHELASLKKTAADLFFSEQKYLAGLPSALNSQDDPQELAGNLIKIKNVLITALRGAYVLQQYVNFIKDTRLHQRAMAAARRLSKNEFNADALYELILSNLKKISERGAADKGLEIYLGETASYMPGAGHIVSDEYIACASNDGTNYAGLMILLCPSDEAHYGPYVPDEKKELDGWLTRAYSEHDDNLFQIDMSKVNGYVSRLASMFDVINSALILVGYGNGSDKPVPEYLLTEFETKGNCDFDGAYYESLDLKTASLLKQIVGIETSPQQEDSLKKIKAADQIAYGKWDSVHSLFFEHALDYITPPENRSTEKDLISYLKKAESLMPQEAGEFARARLLKFMPYPYGLTKFYENFYETYAAASETDKAYLNIMCMYSDKTGQFDEVFG